VCSSDLPSDEEAVQWYQLATDQGHEKARFNLTSLRKAISFRDFNPDEKEIEAAFDAAEAKAGDLQVRATKCPVIDKFAICKQNEAKPATVSHI
jgi:TPR repeat protein